MSDIKGVDILTSNDVMIPVFKGADFCSFCCLLAFTVCLIFLFTGIQSKKKIITLIFTILSVLSISATFFFFSLDLKEKASGIKEYKATISEDANFVEVNDRYEVVSQEGKLYILRDKDANGSDEKK